MNKMKKIFTDLKFCKAFAICCLLFIVFMAMPALAASSNGCGEDTDNDYINPNIALCTTHVYNIGNEKNPTNEADRKKMNDVIAYKTTIMTQQMKKQYDFLDVTLKRFKTQLEKAILTAKLEAAGAASEESREASSPRSNYLSCGMKNETDTIACIRQNLGNINNEIAGKSDTYGISPAIRKQLEADFSDLYAFKANASLTEDDKKNCTNIPKVKEAKTCMRIINGGMSNIENKAEERRNKGRL
jgi:hypothetical protein